MLLMELKVKLQKEVEKTYLQGKKQQTKYRLTYKMVWWKRKGTIDVLKARRHHER